MARAIERGQGVAAVALCLVSAFAGGRVDATSWIPPRSIADLARSSDAVVLARAGESAAVERGRLVWTETELEVIATISGEIESRIDVLAPGGRLDAREWMVAGSPRFEVDSVYLVCLHRRGDGGWTPTMLAYGLLREEVDRDGEYVLVPVEESDEGHSLPRPDGAVVEPVVPYRSDAFLPHLAAVVAERERWDVDLVRADPESIVARPGDGGAAGVPGSCVYFNSNGRNWRWPTAFRNGETLTIYGTEPGDPSESSRGFRRVQEGLDFWMNVSGTSLNLLFGGAREIDPNCGGTAFYIMFDDPCSDIADLNGCSGVLAFGGGANAGTHSFDGTSWNSMVNWFVVMNDGVGCVGTFGYRSLVAHELGHGLGFGHSPDSGALMWGTCCNAINNSDRTCARYTYPAADPDNARPTVDAGADRTLELSGDSTTITGTASDDGLPTPARLSTTWVHLVGPTGEPATFANPRALSTRVSFPESGKYLLGLIARDGRLVRMDQVELDVTISRLAPGAVAFEQGVGGYNGTVDTVLSEAEPDLDGSLLEELAVDGDDPGGSGLATQVLLRFDDLFGTGAGRVPSGGPIRSARLELVTTNPGSGATFHRMLGAWSDVDTWAAFGADGVVGGDECAATPDTAVDAPGTGPLVVDVTESLDAWTRQPCANRGWALLPRGDDGWDFRSSESLAPPRLVVEPIDLVAERLIAIGDEWSLFAATSAPPVDWREPDFVAGAGWTPAATGIGYGDGDDTTVLDGMQGSYPSVFCRRGFALRAPVVRLALRIDYDDGFVAYLNGEEVARSASMGTPGTAVAWNALADDHEAGTPEEFVIPVDRLVAGHNVLAVEVHNASLDSSDLSFLPELVASSTFIDAGSEWRFLRGSEALPAAWIQPGFDDGAWDSGATGIGYGDGDDTTVLDDMRGGYAAVFCRRTFDVASVDGIETLLLALVYDDGVVVWLNGVEVARANMPAGPVTRTTTAAGAIEPTREMIRLPADELRVGRNVLAISVHNASLDSSDLSFDPALTVGLPVTDCESTFRRGDANDDAQLDVSDAVRLLRWLFGGEVELVCPDAADVDDDGTLAVTDAIAWLDHLFRATAAPPRPGGRCGPDPTADELGECEARACGA